MLERVIEAMIATMFIPEELPLNEHVTRNIRNTAIAAMKAMREPSEAVLDAGPSEPYMDREVWARMIDAGIQADLMYPMQRVPHRVMTPEEYAAMPIKGWHRVCRDVDGAGGLGIQFVGNDDE
jgi:hypothetical protein